jgi:hypothetical protein
MRRALPIALVSSLLIAAAPATLQADDVADRNLAVLKTIYTKLRNQFTLGNNSFGADQSFLVMTNPGITLDPN